MASKKADTRNRFALILVALAMLMIASDASAQEDSLARINAASSMNGDANIFGNKVTIEAPIEGDAYVFASDLRVEEPVSGDLVVFAGTALVDAAIGDDARVTAGKLQISSDIFSDLYAAGAEVVLSEESAIGGDAFISAGKATLLGTIQGDLNVQATSIYLNGIVEGDARIRAAHLSLGPDAEIKGNIEVPENLRFDESKVDGKITRSKLMEPEAASFWEQLLGRFLAVLMLIFAGLTLFVFAKAYTERCAGRIYSRPFVSLLLGIGVMIAIPILVVLMFVTIVLIPVAMLLAIFYILAALLGLVIGSFVLGRMLFKIVSERKGFGIPELCMGAILVVLLSWIPYIGTLLIVYFLIAGLGASSSVLLFKKLARADKKKSKKRKR